ncbi:MAG TPA: hypothetical protein VMM60_03065 [Ilumatobacter sp.]|nr:hypothetical protein [Ilumatobacter sp.]
MSDDPSEGYLGSPADVEREISVATFPSVVVDGAVLSSVLLVLPAVLPVGLPVVLPVVGPVVVTLVVTLVGEVWDLSTDGFAVIGEPHAATQTAQRTPVVAQIDLARIEFARFEFMGRICTRRA